MGLVSMELICVGLSWMGQISGALTWEAHNSSQQNHDKDIFNSSNLPKARIPMGFLDLLTPPDVLRAFRLST